VEQKETKIYRISYNKQKDAYETFFYIGTKQCPNWDDFKHEATFKCVQAWNADRNEPTEGNDFVHFRVIAGINRALDFGYQIEFIDRPEQ